MPLVVATKSTGTNSIAAHMLAGMCVSDANFGKPGDSDIGDVIVFSNFWEAVNVDKIKAFTHFCKLFSFRMTRAGTGEQLPKNREKARGEVTEERWEGYFREWEMDREEMMRRVEEHCSK
jgi:hypothetical protein